jgi:DNA-binding NtrC family response regulator
VRDRGRTTALAHARERFLMEVCKSKTGTAPGRSAPASADVVPLTILAVDDDALVLMNTTAMLEDLGHTAIEALSGAAALEALQNNSDIALVITDQAMPGMSGVALGSRIGEERPDVPVIIATGYAELPPGSPPFVKLNKPFDQDALARAIRDALKT